MVRFKSWFTFRLIHSNLVCSCLAEDTFNWKQFAWCTELENNCWSKHETNTTNTVYTGAHFSEVDAVIMDKVNDLKNIYSKNRPIFILLVILTTGRYSLCVCVERSIHMLVGYDKYTRKPLGAQSGRPYRLDMGFRRL